ncbi:MAG: hypothetical protein DLM73_16155 [Chthoniobacterales bacterium]|nr:MAG: hypothetical protein DLM73_16155 [Chthoniobacterales bacterium]
MAADDFANLTDDGAQENDDASGGVAFVLSNRPMVSTEERGSSSSGSSRDYEDLGELPRSYGRPLLVAIARDPHTLFAYWDLDWPEIFGGRPPVDRKIYLRAQASDGTEETRATVEPFAGSHCLPVTRAGASYQVELGYYEPAGVWNSVAMSDPVMTPPDDVADNGPVDVATVPFHLSFQSIVDAFRGSQYDGDALVEIIGRLQEQADDPAAGLAEPEREIMRAIDLSLSEADTHDRSHLRKADDTFATRQRIEAILGFGASSPGNGFSGSSRR